MLMSDKKYQTDSESRGWCSGSRGSVGGWKGNGEDKGDRNARVVFTKRGGGSMVTAVRGVGVVCSETVEDKVGQRRPEWRRRLRMIRDELMLVGRLK